MFSANENIMLRQHKRRVIEYVESTIPEDALDMGTAVMAMQVSCREPGCVPLETAITVVFPKPPRKIKKKRNTSQQQPNSAEDNSNTKEEEEVPSFPKPLIPNLEESRIGGNFKTRILKPLSDVTKDDVLDALPPEFKGGRRTVESICIKARDMIFAQIGQLVGSSNEEEPRNKDLVEGRRLVAEYLKVCLDEYVERGCIPPEWGEKDGWGSAMKEKKNENTGDVQPARTEEVAKSGRIIWGEGNIVFKRPTEEEEDDERDAVAPKPRMETFNYTAQDTINNKTKATVSTSKPTTTSSQQLLQQITKSDHAPGIRRAGCPCCDPDAASNYADKMMMGGLT